MNEKVTARVTPPKVTIQASTASVSIQTQIVRDGINPDTYSGEYTVTPTEETQVLSTNGKLMAGDVTVAPIPTNYGRISWNGSVMTIT